MKELTSFNDDIDKRIAIFFGLGALLMSTLVGLLRGYTLEGFLLQGVVVLVLAIVGGWIFGFWLRQTLAATQPKEELPQGTERTSRNAESLEEGSLVIPSQSAETIVAEDPGSPSGQVVNFSFPELAPPFAASEASVAPEAPAAAEEEGDLPPPPVPGWLK